VTALQTQLTGWAWSAVTVGISWNAVPIHRRSVSGWCSAGGAESVSTVLDSRLTSKYTFLGGWAKIPTTLAKPLHPASVYRDVVRHDARAAGLLDAVPSLCAHSLRATAATTALEHKADIAKAQVWLGHADISTTRVYDKRQSRLEDSPTFKVWYDA